jgi:hypothetical protein
MKAQRQEVVTLSSPPENVDDIYSQHACGEAHMLRMHSWTGSFRD